MKFMGGEIEYRHDGLHTYLTDSGRSSLRLLLKSGFKDKKFLLPDFLCGIIPAVLAEFGVTYEYYSVNPDLSINRDSLRNKEFDVLYLIHYFGQKQDLNNIPRANDVWVLEDCVFLPVVDPPSNVQNWIGFNSFRKISFLADGSILKSTTRLARELISKNEPPFASMKYEAKKIKHEFLHNHDYSEELYLKLFKEAEALVDKQTEVYQISSHSMANVLDFYRNLEQETAVRAKNYRVLDDYLRRFKIPLNAEYHTLYVMHVEGRNELSNFLFSHNIFLPVHWPNVDGTKNTLYDGVISVPVDSRYDETDMTRVAELINRFYKGV